MKTLELNGREILAVEVPEDAYSFDTYNWQGRTIMDYWMDSNDELGACELPFGKWQILGRPSEITEDVARGIIGFKVFQTCKEYLLWNLHELGIENELLIIKNK